MLCFHKKGLAEHCCSSEDRGHNHKSRFCLLPSKQQKQIDLLFVESVFPSVCFQIIGDRWVTWTTILYGIVNQSMLSAH